MWKEVMGMAKNDKYKQAKKRVKALKEFYTHLAIYLAVIALLFFIDYSDRGNWWVHWPAMGWGVAVVIQGVSIGVFSPDWEEKKIKEIMESEE
jgi:fatty acid desaturase